MKQIKIPATFCVLDHDTVAESVFIGLGSNLNNPIFQIESAIARIGALNEVKLLTVAPFYENPPVGYLAQPHFINTVIAITTSLSPLSLLESLQNIEHAQGRARTFRNAPRTLDCDILWFKGQVLDLPGLTVPHPRMHERPFVYIPLQTIAPTLTIPAQTAAHAGVNCII